MSDKPTRDHEMTANENSGYVQGIMDATLAVAEITGEMQIGDFNEKTWKMVCDINTRLLTIAAIAAERLTEDKP